MTWFVFTIAVIAEVFALVVIVRMWRSLERSVPGKILWTLVLLIPIFGLLFYVFATNNPPSQDDHTEDSMRCVDD